MLRKIAPDYKVRVKNPAGLDPIPLFEDVIFSEDVIQAVIVEKSDLEFLFLQKVPKAPDLFSLRLKTVGGRLFDVFVDQKEILLDLQNLTLLLAHLALFDRPNCSFSTIFEGTYTEQNDVEAGPLLLQDKQLVSIGYGRRKERSIFLFGHWLVFSREKRNQQIGAQRVRLEDLLLVLYRRQSANGGGVLTVYWNQGTLQRQKISGAEIYFDDVRALIIWAGFLAVATTASINGSVSQKKSEDRQTWPTRELLKDENSSFNYLVNLGAISMRQALDQLLPLLKSPALLLYADHDTTWKRLELLGEQVCAQGLSDQLNGLIDN